MAYLQIHNPSHSCKFTQRSQTKRRCVNCSFNRCTRKYYRKYYVFFHYLLEKLDFTVQYSTYWYVVEFYYWIFVSP